MLPFIVHVKLTGGKDGPETQVAFNNSPTAMPFLLLFGILYTDSTGLWAGSSATSIFAVLVSVWKSGASADTSHWYFPEMIRGTERNVTVCSFDFDSCVCVRERNRKAQRKWTSICHCVHLVFNSSITCVTVFCTLFYFNFVFCMSWQRDQDKAWIHL